MSLLADANRRFNAELLNMVNRDVKVVVGNGTVYKGRLVGIDNSLNIILENAVNERNERFPKVLIMSRYIVEIALIQERLDLREFAEYINPYFPGMVKYVEEANIVMVGSNVRVTEAGVEGVGPLAKRVKELFDEYMARKGR